MHRTVSPEEHLSRVSEGHFPEDTRAFLQDVVNAGLKNRLSINVFPVGKYQRDQILRELWLIVPGNSHRAKAKALISGFRRFSGRVVAGQPVTALYGRLNALEAAGVKMPGQRQLLRICTG